MMPKKSGSGTTTLACHRCGYEIAMNKNTSDYKLKFQVDASKKIHTSKAVEARRTGMTPEEREMLREYYEIFLESFQEEGSEE